MWTDTGDRASLVVICGRPGSGKTTLARELAHQLAWPLISRDAISEGLFHTVKDDPDLARKDLVAAASFQAFFETISLLVSTNVSLLAEAAFQDGRWRTGLEPILPAARLRIIHCEVDTGLAQQRAIRRSPSPSQFACDPNAARAMPGPQSAVMRPFEPLSLPVPSMCVSTVDGYVPGLEAIAGFARSN